MRCLGRGLPLLRHFWIVGGTIIVRRAALDPRHVSGVFRKRARFVLFSMVVARERVRSSRARRCSVCSSRSPRHSYSLQTQGAGLRKGTRHLRLLMPSQPPVPGKVFHCTVCGRRIIEPGKFPRAADCQRTRFRTYLHSGAVFKWPLGTARCALHRSQIGLSRAGLPSDGIVSGPRQERTAVPAGSLRRGPLAQKQSTGRRKSIGFQWPCRPHIVSELDQRAVLQNSQRVEETPEPRLGLTDYLDLRCWQLHGERAATPSIRPSPPPEAEVRRHETHTQRTQSSHLSVHIDLY